ncbi:YesL family protein [Alkalihalobacillus trypoxylicola]|uniref:DUF624 domain-containing protein n=1 Tax=Alkalihalobacillus trypoxylicola TaxID=519424 RepID=A0A161PKB8_9BACI|nr:DUF624 domain-containing protein [Alkalihalobacillus trypoxylicola]KYG34350.1 hypothetical protein AZF04_14255 [Alkalihalobacillus trypoxylicola]
MNNVLDSGFYRFLEKLTNYFLLNIIWIISILPIITFFPATAALFAVIRDGKKGEDFTINNYFKHFAKNFKQSFTIGIIFFVVTSILYIDLVFISQYETGMMYLIMLSLLFLLVLLLLFISVFIFPILVSYNLSILKLIKQAFYYSIMFFPTSFCCMIILLLAGCLIIYFPFSVLLIFSYTALLIFSLCNRTFYKVEQKIKDQERALIG